MFGWLLIQLYTATSTVDEKWWPFNFSFNFRNNQKSDGAKLRLYGGWVQQLWISGFLSFIQFVDFNAILFCDTKKEQYSPFRLSYICGFWFVCNLLLPENLSLISSLLLLIVIAQQTDTKDAFTCGGIHVQIYFY